MFAIFESLASLYVKSDVTHVVYKARKRLLNAFFTINYEVFAGKMLTHIAAKKTHGDGQTMITLSFKNDLVLVSKYLLVVAIYNADSILILFNFHSNLLQILYNQMNAV